jgi:hypothetical protein
MGPIPSFQISSQRGLFGLKGGVERLSSLIGYSGVVAAVIFVTVGIAHAQAGQETAAEIAVVHSGHGSDCSFGEAGAIAVPIPTRANSRDYSSHQLLS